MYVVAYSDNYIKKKESKTITQKLNRHKTEIVIFSFKQNKTYYQ